MRPVLLLVAFALAVSPAQAWKKRHRSQGFVPAGTPWGQSPKAATVRSVTVWGPKPVWDDRALVWVHPKLGAATPLHYSAYPYEARRCRCGETHANHRDDWTGYDDHAYIHAHHLRIEDDEHHDRGMRPAR